MSYLVSQIILCLLVAFLFGLLIGWLFKAASCKRKLRDLESKYEKRLKAKAVTSTTTPMKEPKLKAKTKPKVQKKPEQKAKAKSKAKKTNIVDDLKEISGVGPKLEKLLLKNGITNYRQVAEFKAVDIKELSVKLGAFKNRIKDDNWVAQAKKLHLKKYGKKV